MTPDLTIVGLLMAGISALFTYVIKQQADAIKSKDQEIERIRVACEADKAWLQTQLESWATIGKTSVSGLEVAVTKKAP